MNNPNISVIMSIYKEPIEWLHKSIDSVLCQTFSDFEFIIICDNPDYAEGKMLLQEYKEKDNRIVFVNNEHNIGLTKSLNKGLAIAKGEYIARMDADDISMPYRLERQINFMRMNPEIDLCHSGYYVISNKGEIEKAVILKDVYTSPYFLLIHDMIAHPTVMFKSSLLKTRHPFYNECFKSAQDYDLWSFLLLNGNKICYIPEILIKYRRSQQQVSNINSNLQSNNAKIIRRNLISQFFMNNGIKHINFEDTLELLKSTKYLGGKTSRDAFLLLRYFFYYNQSLKNPFYSILYIIDKYFLVFLLPLSLSKHIFFSFLLKTRWKRMEY